MISSFSLNHKLNGFFHKGKAKHICGDKEHSLIKTYDGCHQTRYLKVITNMDHCRLDFYREHLRARSTPGSRIKLGIELYLETLTLFVRPPTAVSLGGLHSYTKRLGFRALNLALFFC